MRETSSLTGVKCRATSVAKNQEEEKERQLGGTVSAMVMGRPVVAASQTGLSCSQPTNVRTSKILHREYCCSQRCWGNVEDITVTEYMILT